MSTAKSLLSVVKAADNFPLSPYTDLYPSSHPTNGERYVPFHLSFQDYQRGLTPIGLLRPHVIEEIQATSSDEASEAASPWQFHLIETVQKPSTAPSDDMDTNEDVEVTIGCVFLADWVVRGGSEGITAVLGDVVEKWKKEGKFPGPLGGWRNEKYSIYGPSGSSIFTGSAESSSKTFANVAFALERSACAIFGLATFGVHMTGERHFVYNPLVGGNELIHFLAVAYEGEGSDMKIWVPRRSATKATWPSRLDNSVAGGIPHGMTPAESMVKECDEEASLPEQLVRKRMRNTGVSTYFYITDDGYLQPEIEYIYDLQLPSRDSAEYVLPKPHDDEVESFALLSVPEVIEALHSGDFKPNCGLILVDFLMRHGLITPENEPNYIEIAWRMRRRLNIAVPS